MFPFEQPLSASLTGILIDVASQDNKTSEELLSHFQFGNERILDLDGTSTIFGSKKGYQFPIYIRNSQETPFLLNIKCSQRET